MPRQKPTGPKRRRAEDLSPGILAVLAGDPEWEEKATEEDNLFQLLDLRFPTTHPQRFERFVKVWKKAREDLLPRWIHRHPGTRPRAWWTVEAPRLPESQYPENFRRPEHKLHGVPMFMKLRERLGGVGELKDTWSPSFDYGVPQHWDPETLAEWSPLTFESQAHYLRRHGLLTEGEAARLDEDDFEAAVPLDEVSER